MKVDCLKRSGMFSATKRIAVTLFCMLCLFALPAIYALAAPTPAEWQQLKSDKAFSYKNEVESMPLQNTRQESAFQKIILSIIHFFAGPAGTLLLWILVIGIVSYIVYWLAVSNGSFFFGGSAKKMGDAVPTGPNEEDISAT